MQISILIDRAKARLGTLKCKDANGHNRRASQATASHGALQIMLTVIDTGTRDKVDYRTRYYIGTRPVERDKAEAFLKVGA